MGGKHLTHHRKSLEATLDHEALLAYVNEWRERRGKKYWPRRYRVEGGTGGNYFLLTKEKAGKVRARYGGRIVEVIPLLRPRKPKGV